MIHRNTNTTGKKLVHTRTNLIIADFSPNSIPVEGQLMPRFDALAWYYGLKRGETPNEIRKNIKANKRRFKKALKRLQHKISRELYLEIANEIIPFGSEPKVENNNNLLEVS